MYKWDPEINFGKNKKEYEERIVPHFSNIVKKKLIYNKLRYPTNKLAEYKENHTKKYHNQTAEKQIKF